MRDRGSDPYGRIEISLIDLNHYYGTMFNGWLFDMNVKKKIPVIYLDLLGDLLQVFDSLVDFIYFFILLILI